MNIAGIVAIPGLDVRPGLGKELKGVLERCLLRTQARSRGESNPIPTTSTTYINEMEEAPLVASTLRESKAMIVICDMYSLGWTAGLGQRLHELDRAGDYHLRGKWFGLIVQGNEGRATHSIEGGARHVLYTFNAAGMILLPQALAQVDGRNGRDHLRLGVDLADMLASQSEWSGHAARSEAA